MNSKAQSIITLVLSLAALIAISGDAGAAYRPPVGVRLAIQMIGNRPGQKSIEHASSRSGAKIKESSRPAQRRLAASLARP